MDESRHNLSVSYALVKLSEYRVENKIAPGSELTKEESDVFMRYYNYAYRNLTE